MYNVIEPEKPTHLRPGYSLIEVELPPGNTCQISFECERGSCLTGVDIDRRGTMLVRAREPLIVRLTSGKQAAVLGRLEVRELFTPAAAIVRILKKSRLKYSIPMRDGVGYVCFLEGLNDIETTLRLREEAMLHQSLAPFKLDASSITAHKYFDEPLKCLPVHGTWSFRHTQGKIGIFLHLYYTDLWTEISAFLRQVPLSFDLWITHCGLERAVYEQILQVFPNAIIVEVENRGRDIWPFISLLNQSAFDGYDYICKIHSKKSLHQLNLKENLLGSRWRRRALYDLLAGDRAWSIAQMFASNATLGIVGPGALRVPNAYYTEEMAWGPGRNWELARQVAGRMGAELSASDISFFAGSMFWTIPAALDPIRKLQLAREDFPEEAGQLDGELQHAIERLFTIAAKIAGFTIGAVGPIDMKSCNNHDICGQFLDVPLATSASRQEHHSKCGNQ